MTESGRSSHRKQRLARPELRPKRLNNALSRSPKLRRKTNRSPTLSQAVVVRLLQNQIENPSNIRHQQQQQATRKSYHCPSRFNIRRLNLCSCGPTTSNNQLRFLRQNAHLVQPGCKYENSLITSDPISTHMYCRNEAWRTVQHRMLTTIVLWKRCLVTLRTSCPGSASSD